MLAYAVVPSAVLWLLGMAIRWIVNGFVAQTPATSFDAPKSVGVLLSVQTDYTVKAVLILGAVAAISLAMVLFCTSFILIAAFLKYPSAIGYFVLALYSGALALFAFRVAADAQPGLALIVAALALAGISVVGIVLEVFFWICFPSVAKTSLGRSLGSAVFMQSLR